MGGPVMCARVGCMRAATTRRMLNVGGYVADVCAECAANDDASDVAALVAQCTHPVSATVATGLVTCWRCGRLAYPHDVPPSAPSSEVVCRACDGRGTVHEMQDGIWGEEWCHSCGGIGRWTLNPADACAKCGHLWSMHSDDSHASETGALGCLHGYGDDGPPGCGCYARPPRDNGSLIDGLTLEEIEARMGPCCAPLVAEIKRLRGALDGIV